jgi:flagellar hook-associated protein 3 FlgL
MRVTENTNFDAVRESIRRTKGRMENLQTQASSLKKLNTPSDDPIGASKVLEVRTDKVNNAQFQMNAKMAETFLSNTDQALSELSDIVVRAKEIAIGQASGASSNEETRLGVVEEVTQLFQQAVSSANRRIGDRYLFGGYKTNQPPIDPEGRYVGDDGQMMIEIGRDAFITMNVPGVEAFNTNPKASSDAREMYGTDGQPGRVPASTRQSVSGYETGENVNVFDELQNLRIALLTGDLDGIRGTLERFDQVHSQVVSTRSKIGSRMNGLQNTAQSLERHDLVNANLTTTLEDADMAQVMSDLAKEEIVFKSALQSSQRLIQPTLMDFLR